MTSVAADGHSFTWRKQDLLPSLLLSFLRTGTKPSWRWPEWVWPRDKGLCAHVLMSMSVYVNMHPHIHTPVRMSYFCAIEEEGLGDLNQHRWTLARRGRTGSAAVVYCKHLHPQRVSISSRILYFHTVFLYSASWEIKPNPSIYTSQRGGEGQQKGETGEPPQPCELRDQASLSLAPVPAQPGDLGEASLKLSLYGSP